MTLPIESERWYERRVIAKPTGRPGAEMLLRHCAIPAVSLCVTSTRFSVTECTNVSCGRCDHICPVEAAMGAA